jgi:hypothetical protein
LAKKKLMSLSYWQRAALLVVLFTYGLLFYLIFTLQQSGDFPAFYSSSQMLTIGNRGYQIFLTTYLPIVKKIAPNLNPPIFLMLFNPLVKFNYATALAIWSVLSFIAGIAGAGICFYYLLPQNILKKKWLTLYLFYFTFFATLMNTTIAQFGTVMLLLLMLGYHFYMQQRDFAAAFFWGMLIATKIFPALLLFFVLREQRYRLFWATLLVFLLLALFPLLIYGPQVYQQYFSIFGGVLWYGDNWNASMYGFLFRIFIDPHDTSQSLLWINMVYVVIFLLSLLWYLKTIAQKGQDQKKSFALTIIIMILLSPFGWVYYFTLLIYPLILSWVMLFAEEGQVFRKFLWFISFFLLNFPLGYTHALDMGIILNKLVIHSFPFYGLILLLYLTTVQKINKVKINQSNSGLINLQTILIILSFSFLVILVRLLIKCLHITI